MAAHDWAGRKNGADRSCRARGQRLRRRKIELAAHVGDNSDHDCVNDGCHELRRFRN